MTFPLRENAAIFGWDPSKGFQATHGIYPLYDFIVAVILPFAECLARKRLSQELRGTLGTAPQLLLRR